MPRGQRRAATSEEKEEGSLGWLRRLRPAPPDLSALREQNVSSLVGSAVASMAGDMMVLVAMLAAVKSVGGSDSQIGLALGAQGLAVLVALPLGGILGDRYSRRGVMVAADVLRCGSQALIAALVISGEATYWQLILFQLVHGAGTGIFKPSSEAVVPEVVHKDSVQAANGLMQSGCAAAGIVGPGLGALAVAVGGAGFALGADAVSFAVSAAFLWKLPPNARKLSQRRSMVWEFSEGCRAFWALPWMRTMVLGFTVINALVLCPFFVFGPTVTQETMGGTGAWMALLIALAIGELVAGAKAISLRAQRPLVTATAAFAFFAVPVVLLAAGAPLPLILVGGLVGGAAQGIFAVLWQTTVQLHVLNEQERARIMSFDQLGSLAVVPIGFGFGGWLSGAVGAGPALTAAGVLMIVMAGAIIATPSVRRLPREPAEDADAMDAQHAVGDGEQTVAVLKPVLAGEVKGG